MIDTTCPRCSSVYNSVEYSGGGVLRAHCKDCKFDWFISLPEPPPYHTFTVTVPRVDLKDKLEFERKRVVIEKELRTSLHNNEINVS